MRVRLYLQEYLAAGFITQDIDLADGVTPEQYAFNHELYLDSFKPIIRCYPC